MACLGKVESLQWIGLIGGKEADRALRRAIAPDGAEDLVKEWIDGPLPAWAAKDRDLLFRRIQAHAALGIVYSQNKDSMQLVDNLFNAVEADCMKRETVTEQYKMLVRAMAARDMIEDIGMARYRDLLGTEELYEERRPYMTKRGWYILSIEYPDLPEPERSWRGE
jgi:hypothetical protein